MFGSFIRWMLPPRQPPVAESVFEHFNDDVQVGALTIHPHGQALSEEEDEIFVVPTVTVGRAAGRG